MAATIPSIIPLGATMSAPARAWLTATRPSTSSVASLSTASASQDAAVAVAGVLAAADVGDEKQVGKARAQPAQGPLDDPVVGEVLGADVVLRGGNAEEDHAGHAERPGSAPPPGPASRPPRGETRRASSRSRAGSRCRAPRRVAGSGRRLQLVLADETAEGVGAAAAAGSYDGSGGHGGKTRERPRWPQPRRSTGGTGHSGCGFSYNGAIASRNSGPGSGLRSPDRKRA